jgi:hypothetical protein
MPQWGDRENPRNMRSNCGAKLGESAVVRSASASKHARRLVKGGTELLTANILTEQAVMRNTRGAICDGGCCRAGSRRAKAGEGKYVGGVSLQASCAVSPQAHRAKSFVLRLMRYSTMRKRKPNKSCGMKGVWGVIFGGEL